MPVRGLLVAVVLLALLGGAAYWSEQTKGTSDPADLSAAPKLVTFQDSDLQQIEIRREAEPPVLIEKDKAGRWQMKWPEPLRVDQDAANTLASSYTGLSWDRLVEDKPADLGSYGLASPKVDVRVVTRDGKKHRLLIGAEAPAGGFYGKIEGDARVFKIATGTKTSLDKSPLDLRDKKLLTFDSEKLSRLQLTAKGRTLEFAKKGPDWQIVKPSAMRADNLQVDELVKALQDATMDTTVEDTSKLVANRIASATVTDPAGTHSIEFLKKGDSYYARSSMQPGIYKLAAAPTAVEKNPEQYRNRKIFDFGFNEPAKIEFRDEAKSYSFSKTGERWSLNGKPADVVGVQSLIDKLRELSAIGFPAAKFGTPLLDIVVTSEGRTEKVAIASLGNRYLARRENEPQLYELESNAVEELRKAAAEVKPPPPPPPPAQK